jgi:hypothetical protein
LGVDFVARGMDGGCTKLMRMRTRESRLEALRHVLAPHEGGDDTRRLMVANWVIDLAPKVAHIAKSEPGVWGVLCRIAPEVWRELLPITLETEPWVPGSRTRKHFETRGIRVPDARPTTRATHARMALREAAEWLPAEAVLALDSLLSHGDI